MTDPTPDFCALCAELLDELELWSSWHDATDLKDRAAAALHFNQAEPQPPAAIVEMVNKLHQINNPAIQSVAPTDEELLRMAAIAIAPYESSGIAIGEYEPETECAIEVYGSELIAYARAVLARWGTPANNTSEEN